MDLGAFLSKTYKSILKDSRVIRLEFYRNRSDGRSHLIRKWQVYRC